ncbi:MAG TPA: V-type ATP synthase subunit D [Nitrososphaerales archaeon]
MSLSSGRRPLPTKIELIRIKRSLQVAKSVHKILEDKRDVLLRRLDELIVEATNARDSILIPLTNAYRALLDAYLKVGSSILESIAMTTPKQVSIEANLRTIVDVQVPTIRISEGTHELTYGFADTSSFLDTATQLMRDVLPNICKAAEAENAIFGLAKELEKTQRLINALEYIIIPSYKESIKFISSTLEEREREDFVKLKHVKRMMERRKVGV